MNEGTDVLDEDIGNKTVNSSLKVKTELNHRLLVHDIARKDKRILLVSCLIIFLILSTIIVYWWYLKNYQSLLNNETIVSISPIDFPSQSVQVISNGSDNIAFITNGEVWMVDENGTNPKKLLSHEPIIINNPHLDDSLDKLVSDKFNTTFFGGLSWSKDGTKLAVSGYSKLETEKVKEEKFADTEYEIRTWDLSRGDIYIVDVQTGTYYVLEAFESDLSVKEINWSYDNSEILYLRERERETNRVPGEIVLVKLDTDEQKGRVLTTYSYPGRMYRGLTWFPERGEIWYKDLIRVTEGGKDIPELVDSLIRFDYLHNQKIENAVVVSPGYRFHTFSFLKDTKIMYFNYARGPEFGTEYFDYEVRISNLDDGTSNIVYSGNECGGEAYRKRCNFAYYSPDGTYAISEVLYRPESPEKMVVDVKGVTWNRDGDKTAYIDNGIIVLEMETLETKKIVKDHNIHEIKWVY